MKKKKREMFSKISNKLAYTLIVILSLILLGIGVYANTVGTAPNPGHLLSTLSPDSPCSSGQYITWNGANLVCTTTGLGWIKSTVGGSDTWTSTASRWTYIDTGDTSSKTVLINGYMDASAAASYTMRITTSDSAAYGSGNLIIQRNWVHSDSLATQYDASIQTTTSNRYVIISLSCASGSCDTAYYGLTVTKLI